MDQQINSGSLSSSLKKCCLPTVTVHHAVHAPSLTGASIANSQAFNPYILLTNALSTTRRGLMEWYHWSFDTQHFTTTCFIFYRWGAYIGADKPVLIISTTQGQRRHLQHIFFTIVYTSLKLLLPVLVKRIAYTILFATKIRIPLSTHLIETIIPLFWTLIHWRYWLRWLQLSYNQNQEDHLDLARTLEQHELQ